MSNELKIKYTYLCKKGEGIPDGITHLKVDPSIKTIYENVFRNYRSLVKVSFRSNVKSVGKNAFLGCKSIRKVKFKNGLVVIFPKAFFRCTGLRKIALPTTLMYLSNSSFLGCENLKVVKLQEGLKEISERAFKGCTALAKIFLPGSVLRISVGTFKDCKNLVYLKLESIESIGKRAFANCSKLCGISIPNVRSIEWNAFSGCTRLLGIELSVQNRQFCFDGCRSLINVSLPPQAEKSMGSRRFAGCTALFLDEKNNRDRNIALRQNLNNRFESLPIHKLCYHAPTASKRELARLLKKSSALEKGQMDHFGMTPFHVVATAGKLRKGLLRLLLVNCPLKILAQEDGNGWTMMEYLFLNMSSKSNRLIKLVLDTVIVEKMKDFHLETYKQEMSEFIDSKNWHADCDERQSFVGEILAKLGSIERSEITSALELALWNNKIRQTVQTRTVQNRSDKKNKKNKRRKIDKKDLRLTNGAAVVIPFVIDFLWHTNSPESGKMPSWVYGMLFGRNDPEEIEIVSDDEDNDNDNDESYAFTDYNSSSSDEEYF